MCASNHCGQESPQEEPIQDVLDKLGTVELIAGERIEEGQMVYRDGSGRARVVPPQESRPAGE